MQYFFMLFRGCIQNVGLHTSPCKPIDIFYHAFLFLKREHSFIIIYRDKDWLAYANQFLLKSASVRFAALIIDYYPFLLWFSYINKNRLAELTFIVNTISFTYCIIVTFLLLYPILENRSTALVKLSMVFSASPCSIPSLTQCLI